MAEVEHPEHVHHDSGMGIGLIIGLIVLLIVVFLLFYYGLPYLRGGGTQVNVPDKVDVNVQPGK